jgi:hypothetical protein
MLLASIPFCLVYTCSGSANTRDAVLNQTAADFRFTLRPASILHRSTGAKVAGVVIQVAQPLVPHHTKLRRRAAGSPETSLQNPADFRCRLDLENSVVASLRLQTGTLTVVARR